MSAPRSGVLVEAMARDGPAGRRHQQRSSSSTTPRPTAPRVSLRMLAGRSSTAGRAPSTQNRGHGGGRSRGARARARGLDLPARLRRPVRARRLRAAVGASARPADLVLGVRVRRRDPLHRLILSRGGRRVVSPLAMRRRPRPRTSPSGSSAGRSGTTLRRASGRTRLRPRSSRGRRGGAGLADRRGRGHPPATRPRAFLAPLVAADPLQRAWARPNSVTFRLRLLRAANRSFRV